MQRPYTLSAIILVFALCSGCGAAGKASSNGSKTMVQVENRNRLSMEVYVVNQGRRLRLGRVGAWKTKQMTIPTHLLFGAMMIHFEMESSGPQREARSDDFIVVPGEPIYLVIPDIL